ncbi:MAG: repeat, subgroup, partial [Chitinophagaceae bacterium]|nr:repeat, subgroup [Chitinophagaceae bacterium]
MKKTLLLFLLPQFTCILFAQTPELVIQSGHTAWIQDFTVSPDHKYMATASADMTVKLWDMRSKKEIRTFRGHKDWVSKVVFSHDNKMIASGDAGGFVFLWDVSTGKLLDTFNHYSKIRTIAFSDDDSRIATFGDYRLFNTRDLKSRALLTFYKMTEQGLKVQFIPGSNNIVSYIASDTTYNMWDIKGDSVLKYISYRNGRVSDFALSRNGQYVISAVIADSGIRIFDLKNWKSYKKLNSYNHYPEHIVLGDDDSTMYTSSNFSIKDTSYIEVKKWNFQSGKCLDSTVTKTESYYTPKIEFSPGTNELLFLYRSARLATIETQPLHFGTVLKSGSTIINIVVEREPGKFMLIGEDGPIKELSVTDNSYRIIHQSEGRDHISSFTPLVNSTDAVIKLSSDSQLYKFNTQSFEKKPVIKDSATIRSFVMSPDQKTVAYYTTTARNGLFINHSEIVVKNFANDSLLFRKPILTYLLTSYGLIDEGKIVADQSKLDTITLTS